MKNINNSNSYKKQQERALCRKIELINIKGGKCEKCGYDKNISALDFHHKIPEDKDFQLDSRHISNTTYEKLLKELEKCELLCSNCHRETHNHRFEKENINNLIKQFSSNHFSIYYETKKSKCPNCGNYFKPKKGKIFCSNKCRLDIKNYPSIDEINNQYHIDKSWENVAKHFGLTRKIINNIRNKHIHIV